MHGLLGFVIDPTLLDDYGWRLIAGVQTTAEVVALSCSIGFVLAWPLCWARRSRFKPLSWAVLCYVTLFRGTPLLCQLYLVYYGGGELRPALASVGLWTFFRDAFFCCIFTFSLNTAAYQSEILRGAIASVPRGQREAAAALGLSPWQIGRRVVFPQALLVALRPLGNELVSMIKASALAAIVTLLDLMGQTRFVFARTFDFSIYLYAAIIYLAVVEGIRRVWLVIERRASAHVLAAAPQTVARAPAERGRGDALAEPGLVEAR